MLTRDATTRGVHARARARVSLCLCLCYNVPPGRSSPGYPLFSGLAFLFSLEALDLGLRRPWSFQVMFRSSDRRLVSLLVSPAATGEARA